MVVRVIRSTYVEANCWKCNVQAIYEVFPQLLQTGLYLYPYAHDHPYVARLAIRYTHR